MGLLLSEDANDPMVLYVFMRTDLPDYQPGKSMAQANHAGTKFMRDIGRRDIDPEGYDEWLAEADGFGTCIVLGCTAQQLRALAYTGETCGLDYGIVHDPTYPIRDGDRIQTLPVDTCGYLFGRKSRCQHLTFGLSLYAD